MNSRASHWFKGFLTGAAAMFGGLVALGMVDAKKAEAHWMETMQGRQCEFIYPRTGRCTQPKGHEGGHPSWLD